MVAEIGDLKDDTRSAVANLFFKKLGEGIGAANAEGSINIPGKVDQDERAKTLAIQVEHSTFLQYITPKWNSSAYKDRARTMVYNFQKEPELRNKVLKGEISPQTFATMSTDDFLPEHKRRELEKMKLQVEKQNTIVKDEGPRIRRTHKGEELVENANDLGHDSIFSGTAARRGSSQSDAEPKRSFSPDSYHYGSASHSPPPYEGDGGNLFSPTLPHTDNKPSDKPLKVDTKVADPKSGTRKPSATTPFDINDVWNTIDASNSKHQNHRRSSSAAQKAPPTPQIPQGTVDDPEIDDLLKDDENESPPYSPPGVEYSLDPDVIWSGAIELKSSDSTAMASFTGTAKFVGGADIATTLNLRELLPSTLVATGRMSKDRVNEYLCSLFYQEKTKCLVVLAVSPTAQDSHAQQQFDIFYNYFQSRGKVGVLGAIESSLVKDVYAVPVEQVNTAAQTGGFPDWVHKLENCTLLDQPHEDKMILIPIVVYKNLPNHGVPVTPGLMDSPVVGPPSTHITTSNPGGIKADLAASSEIPAGSFTGHTSL